jgi:hypothetical protein
VCLRLVRSSANLSVVVALLRLGADVDSKNKNGSTALFHCREAGSAPAGCRCQPRLTDSLWEDTYDVLYAAPCESKRTHTHTHDDTAKQVTKKQSAIGVVGRLLGPYVRARQHVVAAAVVCECGLTSAAGISSQEGRNGGGGVQPSDKPCAHLLPHG